MRISCVYKIENLVNKKIYIGETNNYEGRKRYHLRAIKQRNHENPNIRYDSNIFSLDNFNICIVEQLPNNKSLRLQRESFWISYYGGIDSNLLYNEKDLNHYNTQLLTNMSKGRRGITAYNKGQLNPQRLTNKLNTKYKDENFIKQLYESYKQLNSYSKVAQLYNLPKGTVHRLITNYKNNTQSVSTNRDECNGVG